MASHTTKGARLIIRYGGIHDRDAEPMDVLKKSLVNSGWKMVTARAAPDSDRGRRQVRQFQAEPKKAITEYDVYCHHADGGAPVTKANPRRSRRRQRRNRLVGSHLLEFEKVSFDDGASKPKATDEELNSRYVKGEIRIVTEQARYPLAGILAMLEEEIEGEGGKKELRYKLDPEYQRRHRWSIREEIEAHRVRS